ncbi:MAG TPA: hypothetical protein VHV75_09890 [Solirubrobacteraceae bacterium]|nr:hypothetical protein [Solirubrobacteraceae bacterium]
MEIGVRALGGSGDTVLACDGEVITATAAPEFCALNETCLNVALHLDRLAKLSLSVVLFGATLVAIPLGG